MKKMKKGTNLAKVPPASERPSLAGLGWTFLTNHTHVLVSLSRQPESTLREVALAVGITERMVQKVVSELVEAGYLEVTKQGRRNTYCLHADKLLRHPLESHRKIGDLLELLQTHSSKR